MNVCFYWESAYHHRTMCKFTPHKHTKLWEPQDWEKKFIVYLLGDIFGPFTINRLCIRVVDIESKMWNFVKPKYWHVHSISWLFSVENWKIKLSVANGENEISFHRFCKFWKKILDQLGWLFCHNLFNHFHLLFKSSRA